MGGRFYVEGEQKPRPGSYIRYHNAGGVQFPTGELGVGAAVIQASWGPVGEVTRLENPESLDYEIGANEAVEQLFSTGMSRLYVVRAGSGGTTATATVSGVTLETKYPTSRAFNVTVRDGLAEGQKEYILFENQRRVERFTFDAGDNEVDELVRQVNENSNYLTATKEETATGTLENITNEELAGGEDPDVMEADYAELMNKLDSKEFSGIMTDSLAMETHVALQSYVNRRLEEGTRMIAFVGQDTSVTVDERINNARSFNDYQVVYVGNGYETNLGEQLEGVPAIARVMGETITSPHTDSLTHRLIDGSVGVVGELTKPEYERAAKNGMLVFSESDSGFAQIDYGINTKVTFDRDDDEGWSKIRRTRTRFELFNRATSITDQLIGQVENNEDGRAFVISELNGMIQDMAGIESGEFIIHPSRPPEGDSVWLLVDNVIDLDSIEKFYMDFAFQF